MRLLLRNSTLALCAVLWLITASACGSDSTTGPEANVDSSATEGDQGDALSIADGTVDDDTSSVEADAGDPITPDEDGGPTSPDGQCTMEEVALIDAMNLQDLMGECTANCMMSGATDLVACVAECVAADTELSIECAGCFGEMSKCVMANCSDLCPMDPEGCNACAESTCSEGFQACIGVNAVPPPAMLCVNPPDQQAIEAGAIDDMQSCLPACVTADDPGECFGTCASEQGLSIDCSGCFADLGTCALSSCPDVCTAETLEDAGCTSCMEANCELAFQGCSGLELFTDDAPPSDVGLCDDETDIATLVSDQTLLSTCAASCAATDADGGCLIDCMTEAGVSSGCAGCLEPLLGCIDANCAESCADDTDGPLCGECIDESCGAERESCFTDECPICPQGPGACMNDEDGPLIETLQEAIGSCTGTCADDTDPLACATQCLNDAGLSLDCSGCMAVLAVCTMAQCGASCNPEAQAQDGGAACFNCTKTACGAESNDCFGANGGPGMPGTGDGPSCVNEQDGALLVSDSDPKGVCEAACLESDDQTSCLTACLVQAGFSEPCSDCIGALSACTIASCEATCNNDTTGEQCEACIEENCGAEQAACFQSQDGPGADAMCAGAADQGIMEANPSLIETCMGSCMSDPSNAEACLTQCFVDLGLSDGCSGCVSWMLGCTLTECGDVCANSSDPDACGTCAETQCAEEMATCYGEQAGGNNNPGGPGTGPGGPGGPGGEPGLCSGEDDSALMQSQPSMNAICGQQCFSAEDQSTCIGDCLFTNGLSEECAYCMGDVITCSMTYCLAECMGGGPECQTCTNQACAEQTAACYGGQP